MDKKNIQILVMISTALVASGIIILSVALIIKRKGTKESEQN